MSQVPTWVSDYIGLPFEDKGRTPEEGFDCWGLCRWVWDKHYGISVPSYKNTYESIQDRDTVSDSIMNGIEDEWVGVNLPRSGDGVVIRLQDIPIHIGIMVSPDRFLHVFKEIRTTLDSVKSPRWNQRIEGYYRHQSVTAYAR